MSKWRQAQNKRFNKGTQVDSETFEVIDDRVAQILTAGANVTIVYNDVANTITISSTGGGGGGGGSAYFPGGW